MTVIMATICISPYGGLGMYVVWVLAANFAMGGPYSLCPMAVTNAFGEKNASINNGLFISSMVRFFIAFYCLMSP